MSPTKISTLLFRLHELLQGMHDRIFLIVEEPTPVQEGTPPSAAEAEKTTAHAGKEEPVLRRSTQPESRAQQQLCSSSTRWREGQWTFGSRQGMGAPQLAVRRDPSRLQLRTTLQQQRLPNVRKLYAGSNSTRASESILDAFVWAAG